MERFTISLDDALAAQFDSLIAARGYGNRSEAIRDLIRGAIETDRQRESLDGQCIANLSYVYNHHERVLAERLTSLQHDHHDLTVSSMHCHLDHEHCIESVILKGPTADVRRFAADRFFYDTHSGPRIDSEGGGNHPSGRTCRHSNRDGLRSRRERARP